MPIVPWLALATMFFAPDLQISLEWLAPEECPDAREVAAMLATSRPSPTDPLLARAVVTRASTGAWVLRLELHSTIGRRDRTLQADECSLLARAAALVIAVHLDARARQSLREPDERAPAVVPEPPPPVVTRTPKLRVPIAAPRESLAPAPQTPRVTTARITSDPDERTPALDTSAEPPDEPVAAPLREPSLQSALAGHVRVEGGLDLGLLPGVGGSLGLAGGLTLRRLRLEAGILGVPARSAVVDQRGGRSDRLAATLRVCPGGRVRGGAVSIFGCVGGEAGAIRAVGNTGITVPNPQWAPWGGLLLGPALRWRLAGPVGLWFALEGVIALTRPTFTTGPDADRLFQVGPVGLRVHLGVDLQFVARKR